MEDSLENPAGIEIYYNQKLGGRCTSHIFCSHSIGYSLFSGFSSRFWLVLMKSFMA